MNEYFIMLRFKNQKLKGTVIKSKSLHLAKCRLTSWANQYPQSNEIIKYVYTDNDLSGGFNNLAAIKHLNHKKWSKS